MELMAPVAICAKCGGTGFVIVEGVNVSGAKPCECRSTGRAGRLEGRAAIPPLYANASFDNFSVPGVENPVARRELTGVVCYFAAAEPARSSRPSSCRIRPTARSPTCTG